MGRPQEWGLYVDESGDFSSSSDELVVAGLLLPADDPRFEDERLRRDLRSAAPSLPWPPHAAYYSVAAWLVACHAAWSGAEDPVLDGAASFLSDRAGPEFEKLVAPVQDGREPPLEQVFALNRVLRQSADHFQGVRDRLNLVVSRIGAVLRGWNPSHSNQRHPARIYVTASDAAEAGPPEEVVERYLPMLDSLLTRVRASLINAGGDHHVRARILVRNVLDPVLNRHVPLNPRHLQDILGRWMAPKDSVRITVESLPKYSSAMDAALVIADFAANRARQILRQRKASLRTVESQLVTLLGATARSGNPALSHLTLPATTTTEAHRNKQWILDLRAEEASALRSELPKDD